MVDLSIKRGTGDHPLGGLSFIKVITRLLATYSLRFVNPRLTTNRPNTTRSESSLCILAVAPPHSSPHATQLPQLDCAILSRDHPAYLAHPFHPAYPAQESPKPCVCELERVRAIECHVVLVGHVVLVELEIEVGFVGGGFLEAGLSLVIEAVEAQTVGRGYRNSVGTDWMDPWVTMRARRGVVWRRLLTCVVKGVQCAL